MSQRFTLVQMEPRGAAGSLAEAVRAGLSATPKQLPCRFFYDEVGSRLFEQICELPEYYVTRSERAILEARAPEIASCVPAGVTLVELGSGSAAKTRLLIAALLARQETLSQGHVNTEHLSSGGKGIFRHRINGIEAVPPMCVLRYPVKAGDSWMTDAKLGEQTAKLTSRVGAEEVTVPAGKYKAVTVQVEGEADGAKIRATYWFVANIGLVKQVGDIGGTQVTLEMEKFEAGK